MVLYVVQKSPRPDILGGQNGQTERDDHPARAGCHQHDHSGEKGSEAYDNLDEAFSLLQCFEPHASERFAARNRNASQ